MRKLKRSWTARFHGIGIQSIEVTLPGPDFLEVEIPERLGDVVIVEVWEHQRVLDNHEPVGSVSSRLLVRYCLGGEVKSYRQLCEMQIPDFPLNTFMYSETALHLGTAKGWLPISKHDVVLRCFDGKVPAVRLSSDGSG